MKRIIQIVAFILFAIALAGLMGFIYLERENQTLAGIELKICRNTEKGFLNEAILLTVINTIDSIHTKKIKQINTRQIEALIQANPYVENADVFVNINNDLMVNVREKTVVLRIFNQKNGGYYIDKDAQILPLSEQYSPRVLIVNGYLDVPYVKGFKSIYDSVYYRASANGHVLAELFKLAHLIRENTFLDAQISQVYINSKGEFDLIPQLGNQLIHFGDSNDAANKLEKLETFYKKALTKAGWEKYKTINLKYKGQVVCTKK